MANLLTRPDRRFQIPPGAAGSASPDCTVQELRKVTIVGERTRYRSVRAPDTRDEVWLENAPVCPAFAPYAIVHLGVVEAYAPYRFVRPNSTAVLLLACLAGKGRVLIDGEWVECHAGMATLMPQHGAIGYYSHGAEPWKLVWVCYQRTGDQLPLTTPSTPVLAAYDPLPLFHAVEGLRQECLSARDSACLEYWASLVHRLVLRFAQPWQQEDRLHDLWERVGSSLNQDWTLDRLAAEMGCCGEVLRRHCQQQLGRSPVQHLTYLRLRRAAELLVTTDYKIEYVASLVGYSDAFAFSAMFKKWTGCSPKEFREQRKRT